MWKKGNIDGYTYDVKHYESGSQYGINEGAISKLSIRKDGKELYNYDRGLDFDRLDKGGKAAYTKILEKYN
jgi:hypothetical protein